LAAMPVRRFVEEMNHRIEDGGWTRDRTRQCEHKNASRDGPVLKMADRRGFMARGSTLSQEGKVEEGNFPRRRGTDQTRTLQTTLFLYLQKI
jgi:hypothetical protein